MLQNTDPRIVFLDEHVVVVDKPGGMPSVPARSPLEPICVGARLAELHGPLEAVHRLDRDTSGLLVLARNAPARAALGRAFEARDVRKRYLAVVTGSPPRDSGVVHLPLADDPNLPPRKRVDPVAGRPATSRWRSLATAGPPDHELTLLELEPVTGRSHQLRAHLAWLGLPIVGDRLYGPVGKAPPDPATAASDRAVPLALHACGIDFPHPVDGRRIELRCPVPTAPPWTLFPYAAS